LYDAGKVCNMSCYSVDNDDNDDDDNDNDNDDDDEMIPSSSILETSLQLVEFFDQF